MPEGKKVGLARTVGPGENGGRGRKRGEGMGGGLGRVEGGEASKNTIERRRHRGTGGRQEGKAGTRTEAVAPWEEK